MFVGIDISLSKAGFAMLSDEGVVERVEIFHSACKDKLDRIIEHTDAIMKILESVGNKNVGFVAVEAPAYGAVQFVSYDIGFAYGIMLYRLIKSKFNYIEVAPSKLRTFVSGHRYKGKEPTRQWCLEQGLVLPEKVRKEYLFDMCDAFVLSRISLMLCKLQKDPEMCTVIPANQLRIFKGADSKGRVTGLLDRPDLCRVFNEEK